MFYYLGRKQRIAGLYEDPKFDRIIEPFAGSAAYSLHGNRWRNDVTLVEKDPNTCDVWRYLIAATPRDIAALPDVRPGDKLSDHRQLCNGELWLMRYHICPGSSQRSNVVSKFTRWNGSKRHIAANLHKIRHWTLIEGDYRNAPAVDATWFIDPPYHRSGRFYMTNDVDYAELGPWAMTRRGQVTVCEQEGADWLPFQPLISHHRVARGGRTTELIWRNEEAVDDMALFAVDGAA